MLDRKKLRGILLFALYLFYGSGLLAQSWKEYSDSAKIFRDQNKIDQAIEYYILARESLPKDSLTSDTYIGITTLIANLYFNVKSQYATAEPYFLEAREIIKMKYGAENDRYITNANFLGMVNHKLIKYRPAENYYTEAKQITERLYTRKSKQYAVSCNFLGILFNDDGQFEKAEQQHFEAKTIREQFLPKEEAAYAQSCNNLAAIYWNLGKMDKAEPLAIQAKEIRGRAPGIPKSAYAISCVNLGNIYRDMGKYEQAEALYIDAKNAREIYFTKQHDDYALSCDILADLYYYMKLYNKAEPLYLEAKGIREILDTARKGYYYGQSCGSLAALYREMGKYKEAESLALEAQAIWENIGAEADGDLAINTNNLGALYYSLREYDKAEQFFIRAREIWKKRLGESHPFYTENSLSLARVYWGKNKVEKANELYVKAFEAQHLQSASLFSFTSEEEKQLYLKNITGTEDEYQSFYFDKMNRDNRGQPYLISLQKRNQILSSSQQLRQLIYTSNDTTLTRTYDTWISYKKQIAAIYSKGDMAKNEHLAGIKEKADLLEKDLTRRSSAFGKAQQKSISWEDIQQQLKPSDAAIEFIEFNYFNGHRTTDSIFYAALVLRKGMKEPEYVTLFEKRQVDSLLRKTASGSQSINTFYTRGLKVKTESSLSRLAFNTIWKPLEEKLKGVNTIYFAPAGLLHRIAFAALPVDSATLLSDKYQLFQVSTTAAVTAQTADYVKPDDKIYLFGGVQYAQVAPKTKPAVNTGPLAKRSGFDYLPGTAMEVNQVALAGRSKKYSPVVIKGWDAREDSVKQLTGKGSPRVLHIATHGFFFDDPQKTTIENQADSSVGGKVFQQSENPLFRSGLLFAGANDTWKGKPAEEMEEDGILTAYEVANLYLPNIKLVALSACETALGDIKGSEGVYGLQRAFKMAGAENLLMSLWKVPDAETAEFMHLFYKNVFDQKAIDKSFYEAQAVMRNKYRHSPYKWAAWILIR